MSLDQIEKLPIRELGDPDGFFAFMWITWPKLRDRFHERIFDAWDLKWTSELLWDKENMGTGHWLRKQTEVCLLAVSQPGMKKLLKRNDCRDVLRVKKTSKHSAKPAEMRGIIESLTPGPYLEMFARDNVEGWDAWGHEALKEEAPAHGFDPEEWEWATGRMRTLLPRAKKKGFSVNILPRDLIELYKAQAGKCALTGRLMSLISGADSASPDRIDNSKGYLLGNVRLVTSQVNWARKDRTDEQLRELAKDILAFKEPGA